MRKRGVLTLILFLFILMAPLISSQLIGETQTNINPSNGLSIVYPKFSSVKLNEAFQLNIYVHNITDGSNVSSADCFLQIQNHTGNVVFNSILPYASSSYQINLSAGNFSQEGQYVFYINCNDTVGGFAEGRFDVTRSGIFLDTPESILYIVLILINLLVFAFFVYWAAVLPYSNVTDNEGAIMAITKTKYVKLLCSLFAYGSFLWFFTMFTGIVNNFISLEIYKSLVSNIYIILSGLGIGFTLLIFIVLFVELWKDILLWEEIKKFGKAHVKR